MFKPILFNTEMVKAIQSGRKMQTRKVAKELCGLEPREDGLPPEDFKFFISPQTGWLYWCDLLRALTVDGKRVSAPVMPGNILWVRETWYKDAGRYMYRANYNKDEKFYRNGREVEIRWNPSIHMPKEAARIFLRVKSVRAERLQEITVLDAISEGCSGTICDHADAHPTLGCTDCLNTGWLETPDAEFAQLWDTTIKPADLDMYGWEANPWVWVIEFERVEKPEDWV